MHSQVKEVQRVLVGNVLLTNLKSNATNFFSLSGFSILANLHAPQQTKFIGDPFEKFESGGVIRINK